MNVEGILSNETCKISFSHGGVLSGSLSAGAGSSDQNRRNASGHQTDESNQRTRPHLIINQSLLWAAVTEGKVNDQPSPLHTAY